MRSRARARAARRGPARAARAARRSSSRAPPPRGSGRTRRARVVRAVVDRLVAVLLDGLLDRQQVHGLRDHLRVVVEAEAAPVDGLAERHLQGDPNVGRARRGGEILRSRTESGRLSRLLTILIMPSIASTRGRLAFEPVASSARLSDFRPAARERERDIAGDLQVCYVDTLYIVSQRIIQSAFRTMASGTLEEQMKAKVEWTQLNDGEALTAKKSTRRAALEKNLRDNEPRAAGDDDTEKSMRGWHLATGLSVNGRKHASVIWHSSRPRQFTTKILPVQGMLGGDPSARPKQAKSKKLSAVKDLKNAAASKDKKAAHRKADPKAYAEAKKEDRAQKRAYAVAGGRKVGASPAAACPIDVSAIAGERARREAVLVVAQLLRERAPSSLRRRVPWVVRRVIVSFVFCPNALASR